MSSSDSDSESFWNNQIISAVRKRQGRGRIITERDRLREIEDALEQGADIDTTDCKYGNTALHTAVKKGFQEIVKFLRERGARTDIPNLKDKTAIKLAEKLAEKEILSILQQPIPERSESADCESIGPSDLSFVADNQRPSTSRDSENVAQRNPSEDEVKIKVNLNYEGETFDCESGTLVGFEYQWMYLAFTLQCALQQKDSSYYLATEMVAAEKLDDVVLQYTNNSGKRVGRFVQIKHSSNEKKTISAKHLLATGGDFSVSKYFKSWRRVKKNQLFEKIESRNMILATNMDLALQDLDNNGMKYEKVKDPDEAFKLDNKDKTTSWYKLAPDQEYNKVLYSVLKATSDTYDLANLLAQHIHDVKPLLLDIDSFQYYHVALVKHIFNPKTKKFRDEFIKNVDLSPQVENFREIFLSEYELRMSTEKYNENKGSPTTSNTASEDFIWQNIEERFSKLKICVGFGERPTFVRDPQLTDVPELCHHFVKMLKNKSKDNRVIIVGKAAKPVKVISDNIDKFSGHVLIRQKNKIKFSPRFLKNSQQSAGNINEFKSGVLNKLGDGYDLASLEFEIGKNKICTERELLTEDEMPEDFVADEEISTFLNEFFLAVKQPDFDELDDIIGRNMREVTLSLNIHNTNLLSDAFRSRLSRWFMKKGKKQGREKEYLSYDVGDGILDDMKREVDSLVMSGVTLMYCERMKPNDVHFISEMQPVKTFLSKDGSCRMLEVVAPKNTMLTALRVYDTLRKMLKYKKMDGFIFTDVDTLQLPSILNTVEATLRSTGYPDLLLVDCGSYSSADEYSRKLWNPLCQILKEVDKKIILITQEGKHLSEQFEISRKTHRESEDDHSFQNLTDDTKKKLLGKPVTKFQGHNTEISFGELLDIQDCGNIKEDEFKDISEMIDSNTLLDLILKDEIHICNDLESFIEKDYYINRIIRRRVIIKKNILEDEKISDLFAISGAHEEHPTLFVETAAEIPPMPQDPRNITILERPREEEQFEALCERNKHCNIHWLRKDFGKYIWEKSKGDITHLIEYRTNGEGDDRYDNETYLTHLITINDFISCGVDNDDTCLTIRDDEIAAHDEPVIVSSTAGMGKSSMLTYLSWKLKEKQPNMLVLKINLNSHVEAFAEVQKKSSYNVCDENEAMEFLVKELLKRETDLAKKVIRRIMKKKSKVTLIFDGFDEISPDYEKTVDSLIETLARHGIKKLFVATRPHARKALEIKLKVFSHDIQPFLSKDQEEFLTKFLRNEKDQVEEAQAILKKLVESIDDRTNGLTGIPLQTKLIAEILQNQTPEDIGSRVKFVHLNDNNPEFSGKINLVYLYKHFVEMKFNGFFNRRCVNLADIDVRIQRNLEFKRFIETHTKLAMDSLFDKDKVKEFRLHRTGSETAPERNGIVTHFNDDGRPQFGHLSYAEYFAATLVVDMFKKGNLSESLRKIFVADILVGGNRRTMRAFIDCLWAEKHDNAFGDDSGEFCLDEHRGTHNRTIFHVAAEEGNDQIIQVFLHYLDSKRALRSANDVLSTTEDIVMNLSHKRLAIADSPNDFGETPLYAAIFRGQLKVVEYFCDKGANVNSESKNGSTPLHAAALASKLDIVKYLLGKGANVNSRANDGVTPLHLAAQEGKLDVVEYLLRKGANVNSGDNDGATPLHLASSRGKLDVVKYLLSKGANVDSGSNNGATPLHLAALRDRLDVVKYLLGKGANVDSGDNYGSTPLHAAAHQGKLEVVEYLLGKGANVDSGSNNGATPLHLASGRGKLDIVKYLLGKGANVDSGSSNGSTPLHLAALEGRLDVVKYLLGKGANVDSGSTIGATPLHIATQEGRLNVVEYLLGNGAKVTSERKDGTTLLHLASGKGRLNVVEYLLGKGANVDSEDNDGVTPLHFAAQEGKLDVVEHLLGKGGNVNSENNDGMTPLHVAAQQGKLDVVKYLLGKGANVDSGNNRGVTPLHLASGKGRLDVMEYLLGKGVNVNSGDNDGWTPLHLAAQQGKLDVVEYLLGKGANVDSGNINSVTPLHLASGKGRLDVVESLLGKGASVHSGTNHGMTPLHLAAQEGKLDVVEYLLSKGANVESGDNHAATSLHFASGRGRLDVVEYLVGKGAKVHSGSQYGLTPLYVALLESKWGVVKYLFCKGATF